MTFTDTMGAIPKAIEPLYVMQEPNESFLLYEGPLVLEQGKILCSESTGRIEVCWNESPSIRFSCACQSIRHSVFEFEEATLTIPDMGKQYRVFITDAVLGYAGKPTNYFGIVYKCSTHESELSCQSIRFHIPNFQPFHHGHCQGKEGWMSRGRLVLENDTWRVILNVNRNTTKLIKHLRRTGGYGLTHTGVLERVDDTDFTLEEARDSFNRIHLFLSFLRGLWTGTLLLTTQGPKYPSLPIWGTGCKLSPWKPVLSWFPYHNMSNADLLGELFHTFMQQMDNPDWERALRVSIHWYIESNLLAGGLEGAIIFAQAALELLAWTYFVLSVKNFSATKFDKKPAAEKIRLLLQTFHIPITIPASLHDISGYHQDGPEIITSLRNDFIHPKEKNHFTSNSKKDIWLLSLWYLELSLLGCCGYRGSYLPRFLPEPLYPEEAEKMVPWISQ